MAQKEFEGQVRFVGVGGRDEAAVLADFVTNFNVDGFDHVSDVDGDIWAEYGVPGQPAFAFINDDGTVEMHLGSLGLDGIRERAEALIAQ